MSVKSAQDPQGPAHPGPGAWQPTLDCGSAPIDALLPWAAEKKVLGKSLVKCWHETETTDPAWQANVVSAIQPVAKALGLKACTPAALTRGLVAANPQLNGYSWKLTLSACEAGWAVAEIYAPAVGHGTAFLRQTTSGWSSASLGEVNCFVIPGPLGHPLPPHSLAVSLIDKAGICGSAAPARPPAPSQATISTLTRITDLPYSGHLPSERNHRRTGTVGRGCRQTARFCCQPMVQITSLIIHLGRMKQLTPAACPLSMRILAGTSSL